MLMSFYINPYSKPTKHTLIAVALLVIYKDILINVVSSGIVSVSNADKWSFHGEAHKLEHLPLVLVDIHFFTQGLNKLCIFIPQ